MSILLYIFDLLGGAIVSLPIVMIFAYLFDRERINRKWLWLLVYTLYLNAMLIIVGVPGFSYIIWHPTINLIPFQDFSIHNITGMLLNIVLFVPFGFWLPVYFERYRKWNRTLAAGVFLSLFIEIIQLFTFRATDIDDLLMNTLGTCIGFFVAKIFTKNKKSLHKENKDLLNLIVINSIILLVIIFIRYPMFEWIYTIVK